MLNVVKVGGGYHRSLRFSMHHLRRRFPFTQSMVVPPLVLSRYGRWGRLCRCSACRVLHRKAYMGGSFTTRTWSKYSTYAKRSPSGRTLHSSSVELQSYAAIGTKTPVACSRKNWVHRRHGHLRSDHTAFLGLICTFTGPCTINDLHEAHT